MINARLEIGDKVRLPVEPTGKEFLKKYKLPSSSSVKTALEMLVDKELVYRLLVGYIVYDRFMNEWLKQL